MPRTRIEGTFLGTAIGFIVAGVAILMVNALLLSSLPTEPYQACTPQAGCTPITGAPNSLHETLLVNEVAAAAIIGLGILVLAVGFVRVRGNRDPVTDNQSATQ
ncbi:MAG TPA: hypothetical protein VFG07_04275 [Thermoplasmata archaeon]|nr:hypothetical protein [Thermoplasmata archaeon]